MTLDVKLRKVVPKIEVPNGSIAPAPLALTRSSLAQGEPRARPTTRCSPRAIAETEALLKSIGR